LVSSRGQQPIGKPEERLRVHHDSFKKMMVRIQLLNGNCDRPGQILFTKVFDALSLRSLASRYDGERTKLTTARQYLIEDLLLLCVGIWAEPAKNPVLLHDVFWAVWLHPLHFAACSLHDRWDSH
jgi:hypothetical protein